MGNFAYVARDRQRNSVSGEIEGRGSGEVADILIERGLIPLRITERRARNRSVASLQDRLFNRPTLVDQVFFCRQMYSITKAGIPLHRGLQTLVESMRNPMMRRALGEMRRKVEEGRALSETMATLRDVFPPLMINMVRMGEQTGQLDRVFAELQRNLELEQTTQRQVKTAMRYPVMVISAIGIALVVVNMFVIPSFARIFANFHAELPLITRGLIGMSDWMRAWWMYAAGAIILAILAFNRWKRSPRGAETWGRLSLRIPLFGPIMLKATMARFARTLSMCLRSGIALDQALTTVAGISNNRHFTLQMAAMKDRIAQGRSLTLAARGTQFFTSLVMQMIMTGEETGRLDEMLDEAAEFYEREVTYDVKLLADYIEPVLLIVVSAMVLTLALGIFLPMWDMARVALRH
jgi:MSHA biogenesis protein MshG